LAAFYESPSPIAPSPHFFYFFLYIYSLKKVKDKKDEETKNKQRILYSGIGTQKRLQNNAIKNNKLFRGFD
jgi:hypothetical protein